MAAAASNEGPESHTSATVCAGKTARLHTTAVLPQTGCAKGPDASVVKMTAGLIPGHCHPKFAAIFALRLGWPSVAIAVIGNHVGSGSGHGCRGGRCGHHLHGV
jgi:hypothetical protein